VTVKCISSGQVFSDPDLELKSDCITRVGFDVLTDLIPAGKVKLLKDASRPIGRSAKALAAELARTKKFDKRLLNGLDNLGKALTLVQHNPRDVVRLFLSSDVVFKAIARKVNPTDTVAVTRLHELQAQLKDLFLGLTGISDVESCKQALSPAASGKWLLGLDGHVGPLRLDASSAHDVTGHLGDPDAVGSGQVDTGFASFSALGYGCPPGTNGTYPLAWKCGVTFFINAQTRKLAGVEARASRFAGPGGTKVGESASAAEQRLHVQAYSGCGQGISLGSRRTAAQMMLAVQGGRPSGARLYGGRISELLLESSRHGIGLLFC